MITKEFSAVLGDFKTAVTTAFARNFGRAQRTAVYPAFTVKECLFADDALVTNFNKIRVYIKRKALKPHLTLHRQHQPFHNRHTACSQASDIRKYH